MRWMISFSSLLLGCGTKSGRSSSSVSNPSVPSEKISGEVTLNWQSMAAVPPSMTLPVIHMSAESDSGILLVDSGGSSFRIDASDKSVNRLEPWVNLRKGTSSLEVIQTTQYTAWHLRADSLQWIRWEDNRTDHQTIETPLSELFPGVNGSKPSLLAPREDQVLVVNGTSRVHVQRVNSAFKVQKISGLKTGRVLSSPTGHLFEFTQDLLGRLIQAATPAWSYLKIKNIALPAGTTNYNLDVFGSDEQLKLVGHAVADGFVWMSGAINIGTPSSPELPKGQDSPDVQFANVVEPFMVKHCGACHEGRAPAFIRTQDGVKKVLKDVLLAQKDKIKFRIGLPQTDGRVMPPYAPFPTAEDIAAVVKWLQ